MTRPTTQLTDDDLGDLLTETFAAHEHLADPERAVAIAAMPGPPRHPGRVLLGAAAAVALVAAGTTYVVAQGSDSTSPISGPRTPTTNAAKHQPPLPPLQTDAANRAAAAHEASKAMAAMPVYPGALPSDQQGVPELNDRWLSTVQPTDNTEMRSAWWIVSGATPRAVAHWYAGHAPAGFTSNGTVGGQGDGNQWVEEVYYAQPGHTGLPPSGTTIELQTTRTADGVGIRATVDSVWSPARPRTSYVQDVSSIDVHSIHHHFGRHETTTRRSFTITDPAQVLRAAVAFDALQGAGAFGPISCPMAVDSYTDRIVFHTGTGDVVAVAGSSCVVTLEVSRDGNRVAPALEDPGPLFAVLGLSH